MVTAIHLLPHIHNARKIKAILLRSYSSIEASKSLRKENRIGVLGVCTRGGCAVSAAVTKRRIKTDGTAIGANIGRVRREGRNPIPVLKEAARQCIPEACGGDPLSQAGFPAAERRERRRTSTSEDLLVLKH